ncbi:Stem 28 kDa glycoprotein [Spatholobus suberectus]|nr:Stem 28 kDa glycoprotein [Spatholobus suberectus]
MFSEQFGSDSKLVNQQAYFYARTLNIADKDVFVFSVDMTVLSNLPYYKDHGFGTEPYNATLYDAWVLLGEATTMRETKKLYDKLLALGIKIIFLTGRTVDKEDVTKRNLKSAGFHTWEKLILKDPFLYGGKNALQYKSAERKKLEKEGYRIIGNIGDQWSDILGANKGHRTFKLPNPMYYIN